MTEFFNICGFSAICCAAVLLLSGKEKELSALIASLLYVMAFLYVIKRAEELVTVCRMYFNLDGDFLPIELILQIGGIALGGAVASAICENVGQKGIGNTIEILSVIEIIYISAPAIRDMLKECLGIFGG